MQAVDANLLIQSLDSLIGKSSEQWSDIYWIQNGKNIDLGGTCCKDCAKISLEDYKKQHPLDSEAKICGGTSYQEDKVSVCDDCGAPLRYQLRTSACDAEISAWAERFNTGKMEFAYPISIPLAYDLHKLMLHILRQKPDGQEDAAQKIQIHIAFFNMVNLALDPSAISPQPTIKARPRL